MATTIGVKMQMDGAAQFKADLQQITQKSKELAAEMKAAAAGADNQADKERILAAQIDNAKKKIDQLNKKYDAQKSALDETNAELEEAKKAYGEDSQEVQQLTLAVTKQETALSKTKTEINKATAELNKFENQADEAADETEDLADAERKADDATSQLKGGFTVLKGAMASLVADGIRKAVDGFKDLMTAGPEFADEIATLAKQTGMATDTLQEFEYMSGLIDVDVSTIAGSMKKLTKSMASAKGGTGATADAFAQLGISVTDANGNLRDNEEVFYEAIDALGKIENETERDALAMQLFGKSATDLNPLIEAGSDAMKAFADEAHEMGYVLDEDAIESLSRVQDSFDRFEKQMEGVKNQIAAGLAPALEKGMKKLQDIVQKIDWKKVGKQMGEAFDKLIDAFDWIIEHGDLIKSLLTGIVTALAVSKVMQFVSAVSSMTTALKTATTAQKGLNAAANANPYILLATAVIGVTTALVSYGKSLNEATYNASLHVQKAHELIDATDLLIEASQEQANAYAESNKARETSLEGSIAEIAQVQSLADELRTLADENGVVAESDQARAQFILNELNGALGTEFSINNGIIDQYSVLTQSVDTLIQRQQAMLVLEAQKDAYVEALQHQHEAEQTLADMELQRIDLLNQQAENQARINELNEAIETSGQYNGAFVTELGNLTSAQTELEAKMQDLDAEYQNQEDIVNGYAYNIQAYMDNAERAINEDWNNIAYTSWENVKGTDEATGEAAKAIEQNAQESANSWMKGVEKMLSESTGKKVEFQDLGNGYVRMLADGVQQGEDIPVNAIKGAAEAMESEAANLESEMQGSGYNAVQGLANGVTINSFIATNAGRNLADAFINSFKARMDEGSPSKVMAKSGLNAVLGFTNEIRDNLQMVSTAGQTMAAAFTNSFNPNTNYGAMMNGLSSGVNVSTGGLGSMSNSIVMNIYGADGQNVNALADAVIDRLQRTILGSEAVYA